METPPFPSSTPSPSLDWTPWNSTLNIMGAYEKQTKDEERLALLYAQLNHLKPEELREYATLKDEQAIRNNQKQIYGTQYADDGALYPIDLLDLSAPFHTKVKQLRQLNTRRKWAQLPPLPDAAFGIQKLNKST